MGTHEKTSLALYAWQGDDAGHTWCTPLAAPSAQCAGAICGHEAGSCPPPTPAPTKDKMWRKERRPLGPQPCEVTPTHPGTACSFGAPGWRKRCRVRLAALTCFHGAASCLTSSIAVNALPPRNSATRPPSHDPNPWIQVADAMALSIDQVARTHGRTRLSPAGLPSCAAASPVPKRQGPPQRGRPRHRRVAESPKNAGAFPARGLRSAHGRRICSRRPPA